MPVLLQLEKLCFPTASLGIGTMSPITDDASGQARKQRPGDMAGEPIAFNSVAMEAGRPAEDPSGPEGKSAESEEAEALARSLERLPPAHRQALDWRSRDRRSFEEIGRLLGQSPEVARSLWVQALESLSQQLKSVPVAPDLPQEAEERLVSWVAAYEQALASGEPPQVPPEGEVLPELAARFQRVVACLNQLERVRPPRSPGTPAPASGDVPTIPEQPSGNAALPFHVPGYVILGKSAAAGWGLCIVPANSASRGTWPSNASRPPWLRPGAAGAASATRPRLRAVD
jgi:hypothetical protein